MMLIEPLLAMSEKSDATERNKGNPTPHVPPGFPVAYANE
jgi:hypothetical protein